MALTVAEDTVGVDGVIIMYDNLLEVRVHVGHRFLKILSPNLTVTRLDEM